jgi:multicomponent Na+:H+ antiporter subunit E
MIMSSRYDIEPAIVSFDTDFKTDSARVMMANSITLTPGTITVSVEGDRFTVHCLDKSLAEGIKDSVFVRMLHEFESRWEKMYGDR